MFHKHNPEDSHLQLGKVLVHFNKATPSEHKLPKSLKFSKRYIAISKLHSLATFTFSVRPHYVH
jgi:hypothetical protein